MLVLASAVGFCGSRSLPPSVGLSVSAVCRSFVSLLPSGRPAVPVFVGCASGADALVCSSLRVRPSFVVGSSAAALGRGAFAARSALLVRSLAACCPGAPFVGFVSSSCPAGVVPGRSWRSGASPSGSWSSLALAAGLGLSVVVCRVGLSGASLPVWPGGSWSVCPVSGGALWVPSPQLSLF